MTRSLVRRSSLAAPVYSTKLGRLLRLVVITLHGGQERLAAEHTCDLPGTFRLAERLDPGVRRVSRHLLDPEVAGSATRDLRQVRDRDHLRARGEPLKRLADRVRRLAADARVDLVEDHRLAAGDGGDRERDA